MLVHAPKDFPQFSVQNIAANGYVWTGGGTATRNRFPEGLLPDENNCSYDHVAFNVTNAPEYRRRLVDYGAQFDEQNVPNAGFQMFTRDPVGNKVELNFPNSEAPATVAPGTLSGIQFPHLAGKK